MNLLGAYSFNLQGKERGFTLLEMIMVLGLIALLSSPLFSLAVDFYNARQFDVHFQGLVQSLRRAQSKAIYGLESPFGVYFSGQQYVLFKGPSYTARDPEYDEVFLLPEGAYLSGLQEIVFSRISGLPSDTGDIVLDLYQHSDSININPEGVIDY